MSISCSFSVRAVGGQRPQRFVFERPVARPRLASAPRYSLDGEAIAAEVERRIKVVRKQKRLVTRSAIPSLGCLYCPRANAGNACKRRMGVYHWTRDSS